MTRTNSLRSMSWRAPTTWLAWLCPLLLLPLAWICRGTSQLSAGGLLTVRLFSTGSACTWAPIRAQAGALLPRHPPSTMLCSGTPR